MNLLKKMVYFVLGIVCRLLEFGPFYRFVRWVDNTLRRKTPKFSRKLDKFRAALRNKYFSMKGQEGSNDQPIPGEEQEEDPELKKWKELHWKEELTIQTDEYPLVSVIVPNYNHAPYLKERLDTIYNQTYPNFEVILLDDCSTDNSRKILMRYAKKYKDKTTVAFNETNAGKVFLQWNKGLKLAKGEYIWIAESDDWSEPNFLEEMMKCFRYNSVMLAFARSVFMTDYVQTWSTEEYLSDVKNLRWDVPFVLTAAQAVQRGFAFKNIIPNVSSAVFRNIGQIPQEVVDVCSTMHLSSDWIFYLAIMKGGCISYTNKTTNYYRIHKQSTSLKVQQTMRYYDEYEMVSKYIAENYEVKPEMFYDILRYLLWHYKVTQHTDDAEIVREHYRAKMLIQIQKHRKPNIAMACFSLQSGGGETYPLYLANELHRQGCNVTLIDLNRQGYEKQCHELIDPSVPLVRMRNVGEFVNCLRKLNIDVVHSHHGSVDEIAGKLLNNNSYDCKHVITLHGMYETISDADLEHLFDVTQKSCSCFFYIADKNLAPFQKHNMLDKFRMQKIDNGLPMLPAFPIDRKELGISEDSFVLCLVSRGIPEKGWKEAIESVKLARKKSSRPIDLIIVGDGDIRADLEKDSPEYIHFVGTRSNVRDYFAAADAGFLPTRFPGESYPLVVIEAMMCGKPVIATDIAEVKHQLTTEDGELAGELLTYQNGVLDIEEIAEKILLLAEDEELYQTMKERTKSAIVKFDITDISKKYLEVYKEVTGLA